MNLQIQLLLKKDISFASLYIYNTLVRAKFPEDETGLYTEFKREFYQIKMNYSSIVLQKFSMPRGRGVRIPLQMKKTEQQYKMLSIRIFSSIL